MSSTYPSTAQTLILQHPVLDSITLTGPNATFQLTHIPLPATPRDIPTDSVLIRTLYISNDPGTRSWVQEGTGSVKKGEAMKEFVLGRVVAVGGGVKVGDLKEGDLVSALSIWSDYAVLKRAEVKKLK